jgi:hypothetical protein
LISWFLPSFLPSSLHLLLPPLSSLPPSFIVAYPFLQC